MEASNERQYQIRNAMFVAFGLCRPREFSVVFEWIRFIDRTFTKMPSQPISTNQNPSQSPPTSSNAGSCSSSALWFMMNAFCGWSLECLLVWKCCDKNEGTDTLLVRLRIMSPHRLNYWYASFFSESTYTRATRCPVTRMRWRFQQIPIVKPIQQENILLLHCCIAV